MGWHESRHIDATSFLFRDLAHRKTFEYHGLVHYEDLIHHPRRNRFRSGVRGLQLLHGRRNADDSEDHWVSADWKLKEDQLGLTNANVAAFGFFGLQIGVGTG